MQRITRSQSDRLLTGVCGGVADYFSIDPTLVRLIWIFLVDRDYWHILLQHC